MTHPNRPNLLKAKAFLLAFKMLQFYAVRQFLCLILLTATGAAGASSAWQLGVNYSEWLSFPDDKLRRHLLSHQHPPVQRRVIHGHKIDPGR